MLHASAPTVARGAAAGGRRALSAMARPAGLHRRGRALAPRVAATVQLTAPVVAAPRQVPAHSLALEPVPQHEATISYGKPMRGSPAQLGATYLREAGAVNFALQSAGAVSVSLVLFTEDDLAMGRATYELPLDPHANRTGEVWHVALPGLDPSLLYAYRVTGPHQKSNQPNAAGQRFDGSQAIIDPYARAVLSRRRYGELAPELEYTSHEVLGLAATWPQAAAFLPRPDDEDFDWEGDRPLGLPMEDLVIYEMHVRGFTQHPSAGVQAPGTYLGLIEKLDYLKALGVNAIELLPVFEFNELEYYAPIPGSTTGEHRFNFWGYSTVNFFSPMARYSYAIANGADGGALQQEFKLLVREAHKRGIEVILDVVFNHTAEGNELGPTLSFRGLDNRVYYMLAPLGEYYNYSGCGNTMNCNHPTVRRLIVDCLKYWVEEFHVDGFRFDLASILTRAHSAWHPTNPHGASPAPAAPQSNVVSAATVSALAAAAGGATAAAAAALQPPMPGVSAGAPPPQPQHNHNNNSGSMAMTNGEGLMTNGAGVPTGTPMSDPPLVAEISEDPVLRNTKLIAEAWDCDGLYQVGAFPHYGGRWAEWNGGFRDTVRQFLKGTDGPWAGNFASAVCGSPNLYANHHPAETDWWGNNAGKRWRGNRGPTASVNFVCAHDGFTLADLVAYNDKHNEANGEGNRDGESHNLSWNCGAEGVTERVDVNRLRQRQMRNFVCALLLSHGVPMLQMGDEYGHSKRGNNNTYCHDSDLNWVDWQQVAQDEAGFARFVRRLIHFRHAHPELRRAQYVNDNDVQWHGDAAFKPDWSDASRLVAYTIKRHHAETGALDGGLYVAFNAGHTPRTLELPQWQGRAWRAAVDTGKLAPFDILMPDEELAPEEARQAQLAAAMWTASGFYSILPWSCVVLESVPEADVAAPRARGRGAAAAAAGAAYAAAGGPLQPTEEQQRAARAAAHAAPAGGLMGEIHAAQQQQQQAA